MVLHMQFKYMFRESPRKYLINRKKMNKKNRELKG